MTHIRDNDNRWAFLGALLVSSSLIVGGWAWRNSRELALFTPFAANTNRNRLIYLGQHDLIDLSLPKIRRWPSGFDPGRPVTIYSFVESLGPDTVRAERTAGEFVQEQITYQPGRYGQEILSSLLHWAGFPITDSSAIGRDDVYSWFALVVSDVAYLDSINAAYAFDPARIQFTYVSRDKDTWLTHLLSLAGQIYLKHCRWILFSLLVVLFSFYFYRFHSAEQNIRNTALLIFGFAFLFNWLSHSLFLADYDRFASPFDWVLILLVACLLKNSGLLVGEKVLSANK